MSAQHTWQIRYYHLDLDEGAGILQDQEFPSGKLGRTKFLVWAARPRLSFTEHLSSTPHFVQGSGD